MIAAKVGLIALVVFLLPVGIAGAQPLTEVVKSTDLRERIGVWAQAREVYYSTYYSTSTRVSISVTRAATDFVVERYEGSKLPPEASAFDKSLLRAAIFADLEVLLNRSLFEAVSGQFQTVVRWIATSAKVQIDRKDVEGAIKAENCNVIPCNPSECDPKTCSKKSLQRFLPPPKR